MLKDITLQRVKNQKGSVIYTNKFVKWNGQFLKDKKTKEEIKSSNSALSMKETEIIIKTFS